MQNVARLVQVRSNGAECAGAHQRSGLCRCGCRPPESVAVRSLSGPVQIRRDNFILIAIHYSQSDITQHNVSASEQAKRRAAAHLCCRRGCGRPAAHRQDGRQ